MIKFSLADYYLNAEKTFCVGNCYTDDNNNYLMKDSYCVAECPEYELINTTPNFYCHH